MLKATIAKNKSCMNIVRQVSSSLSCLFMQVKEILEVD